MKHKLTYLATRLFDTPLLIHPSKLQVIMDVLGPRLGIQDGAIQIQGMEDEDYGESISSDRAPYATTEDGIAVIDVHGSLVKRAGWMDAMSGMTSYDAIASKLRTAVNDPAIKGILLSMDTPGGEVSGLYDLTDEIFSARSHKPVYAISDDSAYSAGYAIACSADKVFVTRTGGVGSIGVIAVHVDQSQRDEKMGLKYTAVYAGAHKNDYSSHAPLSSEAKSALQEEIDRCYDMFVGQVARGRNMSEALVRKTQARCFWGENAVAAGLADQIGNYDDALSALRSVISSRKQARVSASAVAPITQGERTMEHETNQPADAPNPAATAQPVVAAAAVAPVATPAATTTTPAPAAVAPVAVVDHHAVFQAQMQEIQALCEIAGDNEMLATAIKGNLTASQVRDALQAKKKAAQAATPVAAALPGLVSSAETRLMNSAQQIATSKGISLAKAYVEALKADPAAYASYLAEKTPVAVNSGR